MASGNVHVHRVIDVGKDPDAFKQRMERQCDAIERYRRAELRRGRALTMDEAALEWIERYAAVFAGGIDLL